MSKRKLCALSLCMLLTISQPQVLDRLVQILSVCTSVLHETEEDNDSSISGYDYNSAEDGCMGPVESEDSRKRQVINADPINKVPLALFLKEKLQTCAQLHGNAAFNTAMGRLHPTLLDQLQQIMQSWPFPEQVICQALHWTALPQLVYSFSFRRVVIKKLLEICGNYCGGFIKHGGWRFPLSRPICLIFDAGRLQDSSLLCVILIIRSYHITLAHKSLLHARGSLASFQLPFPILTENMILSVYWASIHFGEINLAIKLLWKLSILAEFVRIFVLCGT